MENSHQCHGMDEWDAAVLFVLSKCSRKTYGSIIADRNFDAAHCFKEIAHNFLHNTSLGLTVAEKKRVDKIQPLLQKLLTLSKSARRKLLLKKRKIICDTLLDILLKRYAKL